MKQGHFHFTPLPLSALIICPVTVVKRLVINSRIGITHPVTEVKAKTKLIKLVKIAKNFLINRSFLFLIRQ